MLDGFYSATVTTNLNTQGSCVVTLLNEQVWGGDSAYIFIGAYTFVNGIFESKIHCKREQVNAVLIFGDTEEYSIIGSGKPNGNFQEFVLIGYVLENPEMKLSVQLTRRVSWL